MTATTRDAVRRLRFGLFELDPVSFELSRSGRPVRLQPQPAKVLAYLASRPGELVLREDLRRHVWGESFVDAEAGLNTCIRDIRAALGDRAATPTYVATVPRRGYRFIAPVDVVAAADAVADPRPAASGRIADAAAAPPGIWRRRALAAVASIAVAAGGIGLHAAIRSQQSAALDVAPRVIVQVVPVEAPASGVPDVDPAAHEAVLEARYLLDRNDLGDPGRAVERARRAIEVEPAWADAWLVLGDAHLARRAPPHEAMPAARTAFERALTHDPTLAAAHRGLARVHLSYDWDLEAARRALELAERLGGESSETHQSLAFYHLTAGRPEKALEHLQQALRMDPVSARIRGDIGWIYALTGDHHQAVEQCRKGLELEPEAAWLYGCLVASYQALGRFDLAAQAARDEMQARGDAAVVPPEDAPDDTVLHAFDQWRLRRMLAARDERYVPACAVGIRQAQAGHADEAIRQLRIAFDERSGFMPLLEISPDLAALHEDPRFQELASRVKAEMRDG